MTAVTCTPAGGGDCGWSSASARANATYGSRVRSAAPGTATSSAAMTADARVSASALAYLGLLKKEMLPGAAVHDPVNQVISTEEIQSLVSCITSVLSDLESRVLSLYLDGRSYEEVAERLECDTKTVDNALQRVKRKVGAHLDSRAVPE